MNGRQRVERHGSATARAQSGWDPYDVWYTRVLLPRMERDAEGPEVQREAPAASAAHGRTSAVP